MLELISNIVIDWISEVGYPAVFVLMLLESALIPVPSEVTMPFAGFLSGLGKLDFWWLVFLGALGNLVGSWLAYGLGFWGREKLVRDWIGKYGHWILLTEHEFEKGQAWFKHHGGKIAFFSRLMPVVRTFISLPAGIAKMNFATFSIYTFAGSLIWSIFLTYLGVVLGQNWQTLGIYFRKFDFLLLFVFMCLTGGYIYRKVKKN